MFNYKGEVMSNRAEILEHIYAIIGIMDRDAYIPTVRKMKIKRFLDTFCNDGKFMCKVLNEYGED